MRYSVVSLTTTCALAVLAACGGEPYAGEGVGGSAGTSGSGGAAGSGAAGSGGAGGSGASGGTASTGGSGGTTPTCDETASPADEACVIDDDLAVFVSPAGGVDSAGTQADPLKSVQAGLAKAKAAGKRLFVCADGGDFEENLALGAALAGVEVWGGFKCDGWGFDAGLKATVAPVSGVPISATGIDAETSFRYVRFRAPAGVAPGESSIAGFVSESSALSFEQVEFVAQSGVSGVAGTRTDVSAPDASELNGRGASGDAGGQSRSFTCDHTGETTRGGRGGEGAPADRGDDGLPVITSPNPDGGRAGELGGDCSTGVGRAGNPGPDGTSGVSAATLGTLTVNGWAPEGGTEGRHGRVGQGGGGGRGGLTGGGGGGGAGGCGGAPGGGGGGGGASVALLLFNSPIQLKDVELTAADAGDGGAGAAGQKGLNGGFAGNPAADGCGGGRGGQGGAGGGGGGGAGGVSVGVLHLGGAPVCEGGSITVGAPGAPGSAGSGSAAAGVPGEATEVLSLSP